MQALAIGLRHNIITISTACMCLHTPEVLDVLPHCTFTSRTSGACKHMQAVLMVMMLRLYTRWHVLPTHPCSREKSGICHLRCLTRAPGIWSSMAGTITGQQLCKDLPLHWLTLKRLAWSLMYAKASARALLPQHLRELCIWLTHNVILISYMTYVHKGGTGAGTRLLIHD